VNVPQLEATARSLVAPGKGILAADESTGTIGKRFKSIGVESTEATRRAYREALLTASGLGAYISGAILFDETLRQKTAAGISFVDALTQQGIIPGIKVDQGAKPLAGFPDEKITEGLDGLRERLADYVKLGARFTKWRAVIAIGAGIPTDACLAANAHALARFAALSQEAGLVPIVEPEVLMDGRHAFDRHYEVTDHMQRRVFAELRAQGVALAGMLLKCNMVLSGTECTKQAGVDTVAEGTLHCLRDNVPTAVPGVVFLSGGQSDEQATQHLAAINRGRGNAPWQLSFSYGRALQGKALAAWRGQPENVAAAQRALLERAKATAAARKAQ
jgi:fructose-bisphosphate aldolase class I